MLIGASLTLLGVVLLVMTHDLREEAAWPDEAAPVGETVPVPEPSAAGRARAVGFWWAGVALVTIGVVLAAASVVAV